MDNNLDNAPQHWVNRLGFALRRELVQRFRAAGISVTAEEWGAMLILSGGPRTPGQLSDLTLRDRTTVTRLIDRLVARDLVLRDTDAKDRRRQILRLSRAGYESYADMARVAADLVAQSNRSIPPEDLTRTAQVLRQMLTNMTQQEGDSQNG